VQRLSSVPGTGGCQKPGVAQPRGSAPAASASLEDDSAKPDVAVSCSTTCLSGGSRITQTSCPFTKPSSWTSCKKGERRREPVAGEAGSSYGRGLACQLDEELIPNADCPVNTAPRRFLGSAGPARPGARESAEPSSWLQEGRAAAS